MSVRFRALTSVRNDRWYRTFTGNRSRPSMIVVMFAPPVADSMIISTSSTVRP
jgi:hypothetical protein